MFTYLFFHNWLFFFRYRGLKSFRTSPWDKFENLPIEYARIFQFENIKKTFKKVAQEKINGAEVIHSSVVYLEKFNLIWFKL